MKFRISDVIESVENEMERSRSRGEHRKNSLELESIELELAAVLEHRHESIRGVDLLAIDEDLDEALEHPPRHKIEITLRPRSKEPGSLNVSAARIADEWERVK